MFIEKASVLCRACRKTSEETDIMFPLQSSDEKCSDFHLLLDLFQKYTFLVIDTACEQEPYLCIECYEILSDFHKFRKMCRASHYEFLNEEYKIKECTVLLTNISTVAIDEASSEQDIILQEEPEVATDRQSPLRKRGLKRKRNRQYIGRRKKKAIEHQCGFCPRVCYDRSNFLSHTFVQHKVRIISDNYWCMVCDTVFENQNEIKEHIQLAHPDTSKKERTHLPFSCDKCSKKFEFQCRLKKHQEIHKELSAKGKYLRHKNSKFQCKFCPRRYYSTEDLQLHESAIHKIRKTGLGYWCLRCDKGLKNSDATTEHINVEHPDDLLATEYTCYICSSVFLQKFKLVRHMNFHTKAIEYRCEFCPKVFYDRSNLGHHRFVQHKVKIKSKKYWCVVCYNSFENYDEIKEHMDRAHSDERKSYRTHLPYSCDKCPMKFLFQCRLKSHTATHDDRIQIQIPDSEIDLTGPEEGDEAKETEEEYNNDSNIDADNATAINLHSKPVTLPRKKTSKRIKRNAQPAPGTEYTCPICSSVFLQKFKLVRHMNFHTKSMKYRCEFCSKVYYDRSNLGHHRFLQHKVKIKSDKYWCMVCYNVFENYNEIKEHMDRAHSDERENHRTHLPYSCDKCPMKFQFQCRLKNHSAIHDDNNKFYTCGKCGSTFSSLQKLRMHSRYHKIKKEFRCGLCSQSFCSMKDLHYHTAVKHIKVKHPGNRVDQTCEMQFNNDHTGNVQDEAATNDTVAVMSPHIKTENPIHIMDE